MIIEELMSCQEAKLWSPSLGQIQKTLCAYFLMELEGYHLAD